MDQIIDLNGLLEAKKTNIWVHVELYLTLFKL
jgi:hypothetical protein